MKQEAISKINQMGRIGNIITNFAKVFIIIGLILVSITTVLFAFIPKDFVTIKLNENALIDINFASMGFTLSEEQIVNAKKELEQAIQDDMKAAEIDMNDLSYGLNEFNIDDSGMSINCIGDVRDMSLHDVAWIMSAVLIELAMTLITLFFIGALCKAFWVCESPFEDNVIKKMRNFAFSLIPWAIISSATDAAANGFFTHSFKFNFSINLNMVIVILVIFALTYIFKYGSVLQQESDETL